MGAPVKGRILQVTITGDMILNKKVNKRIKTSYQIDGTILE